MSKLIAALAVALAGALAAVLFFWRRSEGSWGSMWNSAKTSTSAWSDAASDEVGKAVDKVSAAVDEATANRSDFADELMDAASQGAHEADKTAASSLVDDLKGATN